MTGRVRPATTVPAARAAKRLRKRMTPEEARLWLQLKRIDPALAHFRKQCPIGPYVVDFAELTRRLVVEVDGEQHGFARGRERDGVRDAWLRAHGFEVLRFWNGEVRFEIDMVLDTVHDRLAP